MSASNWGRSVAAIVSLASIGAGAQTPRTVAFENVSVVPMTKDRAAARPHRGRHRRPHHGGRAGKNDAPFRKAPRASTARASS